jgi:hypothetical protein
MADMDMETTANAPVDYGPGPNRIPVWKIQPALAAATGTQPRPNAAVVAPPPWVKSAYVAGSVPQADSNAATEGHFDPPVTWPIIGLHNVLLPDGRVLNYGSNTFGAQGAQMLYDVWDPSKGTGIDAHSVLPNTMQTDIFCSGQSILWTTGQVLITGGDLTVGGVRNYANNSTTLYALDSSGLSPGPYMQYPRWYPSIIAMPDNDMVVMGGRGALYQSSAQITPEVYNPATGWRTLTGATSKAVFNTTDGWYYPRAFLAPSGKVVIVGADGYFYKLDKTGAGSIAKIATPRISLSSRERPTMMIAPGKLLSVRAATDTEIIDLNGPVPVATHVAGPDIDRKWSNLTVLADGSLFLNGGSTIANNLSSAVYTSQLWDPATATWRPGPIAQKARLYHSIAMLLPDATVLTGSGGAPGPIKQMNAEIYYPPYLYAKDGSGNPAPRPTLLSAPTSVVVGDQVNATVGAADTITAVNFIRTGSVTHTTDPDARLIPVAFTQNGEQVTATLPSDPNIMLPGYYMMFVLSNGVPSVAKIMLVSTATAKPQLTALAR